MRVAPTQQAPALSSKTESLRRKRLGQYYTGSRLANLLSALAEGKRATSVLDPMAGIGDMLVAAATPGQTLGAIEIDPIAHYTSRTRLQSLAPSSSRCAVLGNAFSVETLRKLPLLEWDLVITNPPYVRYQEGGARASIDELELPSADDVRLGLIEAIEILPGLDSSDRKAFRNLAQNYSGLADLAVPSWLLCAGLVRPGGTLAMVVPNAWLTRDYASPIHFLLAHWFDTQVVVEDADAAWFSDALVRTTLLVARRSKHANGYPHLKVRKGAADSRSVVGNSYPSSDTPDESFAEDVHNWRSVQRIARRPFISGHWVSAEQVARNAQEWRPAESRTTTKDSVHIPASVARVVGDPSQFTTLEGLGWRVGQGLRTGANKFFYVEHVENKGDGTEIVSTSKLLGAKAMAVPSRAILPVLRRQSELPSGYSIDPSALIGRVLLLDAFALPEDGSSFLDLAPEMPSGLANYIRAAAHVDVGTADAPRLIPQLSAVAPNQRAARSGLPARFWYQLPNLTTRHRPDLVVARINYAYPKVLLNPEGAAIIDANFSTLWRADKTAPDEFALLAALNSSWAKAILELSGTVLGGGALKIEAAHLRRLPLPLPHASEWQDLSRLGRELSTASIRDGSALLAAIDSAIAAALLPASLTSKQLSKVHEIAAEHLSGRSSK